METQMQTVRVGPRPKARTFLTIVLIVVVLLIAFFVLTGSTGGDLLTQTRSEPLGGVTAARVVIDPGDGNLSVDGLTGGQPVLASAALQYREKKGLPVWSVDTSGGQASLTLQANGGQSWLRLPWAACNGATEWQVHLNPAVASDISTHSDGGNISLNLAGMLITRVQADTGGGNINLTLPEGAAGLSVDVETGAGAVNVAIGRGMTGSNSLKASSGLGNVVVSLPAGVAARIHTPSAAGKALVDPRFEKIDDSTYQSPGYDSAADKVEITLDSGAGTVSVTIQ